MTASPTFRIDFRKLDKKARFTRHELTPVCVDVNKRYVVCVRGVYQWADYIADWGEKGAAAEPRARPDTPDYLVELSAWELLAALSEFCTTESTKPLEAIHRRQASQRQRPTSR